MKHDVHKEQPCCISISHHDDINSSFLRMGYIGFALFCTALSFNFNALSFAAEGINGGSAGSAITLIRGILVENSGNFSQVDAVYYPSGSRYLYEYYYTSSGSAGNIAVGTGATAGQNFTSAATTRRYALYHELSDEELTQLENSGTSRESLYYYLDSDNNKHYLITNTGSDSYAFGSWQNIYIGADGNYYVGNLSNNTIKGRLITVNNALFDASGNLNQPFTVSTESTSIPLGSGLMAADLDDEIIYNAIAFGTDASALSSNSMAVGHSATASGYSATAIGFESDSSSYFSTAVGSNASASGASSTAIGYDSKASAVYAIAIGSQANSSGTGTIAIGSSSKAASHKTIAVGNESNAQSYQSIAIGDGAKTGGNISNNWEAGIAAVSIGAYSNAVGSDSVAVGNSAKAWAYAAIAEGAYANAGTEDSIAIGRQANVQYISGADSDNNRKTATSAIAIGNGSTVKGMDGVAIGHNAKAELRNSTAYGVNSHANGSNAVAIGNKSIAGLNADVNEDTNAGQSAVAIGNRATAISEYSTALGASTYAEGNHAVAVGDSNRATGAYSTAIGAGWSTYTVIDDSTGAIESDTENSESARTYESIGANQAVGDYSTSVGYNNITAGQASSAVGANNKAAGFGSITIGYGNSVSSIEVGSDNLVTGSSGGSGFALGINNTVTGNLGIAVGSATTVTRSNGIAVGTSATTAADNGIAIGSQTQVNAMNSIAVGASAQSTAANSVAVGAGASALNENSVAIGAGSQTSEAVPVSVVTIPGASQSYFEISGTSPVGTVSVGAPGAERQITNVAAGRIGPGSTDAINGSELYMVQQESKASYNKLNSRINHMEKDTRGAIAMAIATAGLPQAYLPGKNMVAMAAATYRGQQGVALGVSSISDNGRWILKGTASTSTRGYFGASIGAGYQW